MLEWLQQHVLVSLLTASGVSTVGGIVGLYVCQYISLRLLGGKHSDRNWDQKARRTGDPNVVYFGGQSTVDETLAKEGGSQTTYYRWVHRYTDIVSDGVKYCFEQSGVMILGGYKGWPAQRVPSNQVLAETWTEPQYGMGLEERKDGETIYYVPVPMADIYRPELSVRLSDLKIPSPPPADLLVGRQ